MLYTCLSLLITRRIVMVYDSVKTGSAGGSRGLGVWVACEYVAPRPETYTG